MKVTISERAEQNLDNIVRYLETEWSVRVRDKFFGSSENEDRTDIKNASDV